MGSRITGYAVYIYVPVAFTRCCNMASVLGDAAMEMLVTGAITMRM
jgi:hypothetical protein